MKGSSDLLEIARFLRIRCLGMNDVKLPNFGKLWHYLALIWLIGCFALLIFSLFGDSFKPGLWCEVYFAAVTVLSPVAFGAFGWDKWRARGDGSRIPEKTLHLLAICGGWPGAVLGQQWFHHKTVKPVFRSILVAIVLLHIGLAAFVCYGSLFRS